MIEVKVDMNRLIETFDMLSLVSGQLPGAAQAAVQDTLDDGREMLVAELTAQINAPRDELNSRVGRTTADRPTRLTVAGEIFLKSRPIRLQVFRPVQSEMGVTYRPYRSGGTKFVRGAFGPGIRRLGGGVFKRLGRSRTPIKREPGLMLTEDPVAADAIAKVEAELPAVLNHNTQKHITRMLAAATGGRTEYGLVQVQQSSGAGGGFRTVNL